MEIQVRYRHTQYLIGADLNAESLLSNLSFKDKVFVECYVMTIIGRIIVWYGSSVGQHNAPYRINHCINFNSTDFIYDAQFMLLTMALVAH